MKKPWYGFVLVALLSVSAPAGAVIGTIDQVPAATLLLPYFEVDIAHPNGVNTLFSINNAKAEAVLAHVTIWTDQAIPALAFDVYLTGFDSQSISLRDVFVNGNLPVTASAGQDPGDAISPRGAVSQDVDLASCSGLPYTNPRLDAVTLAHLQAWLQGKRSPASHDCAGTRLLDNILRGYVTIDTVSACNSFFPSDWASYGPLLTHQNDLWGDVFYVNPAQNFAQGETLVAIESCPTCFTRGDHTFYGRYNLAFGTDGREALPTTMVSRYVSTGLFQSGTDLFIWREASGAASPYDCRLSGPAFLFPLGTAQVVVFDEEETPAIVEECPSFSDGCVEDVIIPSAAQRVSAQEHLLTPFSFGWAYLNLQHDHTAYPDTYAQMWAITTMNAGGRFSVGFDAIQLDNANEPNTSFIPID